MLVEDLKLILKVAEFRSITTAAAKLDMRAATASAAIKRVEEFGGKVRMDIHRYHPEDELKQAQMVYLEDPFGNLFEFYSHSYEDTYASDYE